MRLLESTVLSNGNKVTRNSYFSKGTAHKETLAKLNTNAIKYLPEQQS